MAAAGHGAPSTGGDSLAQVFEGRPPLPELLDEQPTAAGLVHVFQAAADLGAKLFDAVVNRESDATGPPGGLFRRLRRFDRLPPLALPLRARAVALALQI